MVGLLVVVDCGFLIMKFVVSFFGNPVANFRPKLSVSSCVSDSLHQDRLVIRSFLLAVDPLLLRINVFSLLCIIRICFLLP